MLRTYTPSEMRVSWLIRVAGIVFTISSFALCCRTAVVAIYGPDKLPSLRWGAPEGMSLAASSLAVFTWIRPILFPTRRRWFSIAISVSVQTLGLLELYAILIGWAGPDSLFVTIFSFSATRIFREDAWVVFPLICVPIMAIISGTL